MKKLFFSLGRCLWFQGISFLIWAVSSAQEKPRIDFSLYTTEDGLAHNSGNCFAQDNHGFLWVGSNGGLEKFDGYKFTIYKPEPDNPNSLGGTIVWALYVDRSNDLWIGTIGGGLNKYVREKDAFVTYRQIPDSSQSISNNNVSKIFEDLSGRLWVTTKGGGLNLFDRTTKKFIRFQRDPSDPNGLKSDVIHDYCIDPSGKIWLGTENGINTFDPETHTFRAYDQIPGDLDKFDGIPIMTLCTSRTGLIWIGTWRKGLYRYDRQGLKYKKYLTDRSNSDTLSGDEIFKIFEDSFGDIWIATENGVNKYVPDGDRFITYSSDPANPKGLSDNYVRTIFEDQTGVLWVGTNNGGLNKFDLLRKKFRHYTYNINDPNSLSNNHVYSIHEDDSGVIWVATRGGLNRFDKTTGRFIAYKNDPLNPNSLSHNSVIFVTSSSPSEIWAGTDLGVNRLNPRTGVFERFLNNPDNPNSLSNNSVRVLLHDRRGVIWIGTWGGGLDKYEIDKKRFTNYPVDAENVTQNAVLSILKDPQGILWIGTYGKGLVKFNPDSEEMSYFTADRRDPEKLKDNFINALYQDRQGEIWIGTGGGGLSEFDPQTGRVISCYDVKDGLPSSEITGILEDDHGNLWISTGKGISRFDRKEKFFTNFDVADGLQAYVFYKDSFCKNKSGELYFGGNNGFNVFDPDDIQLNPFLPRMTISDFQVLNHPVRIGQKINGRIILEKPLSETKEIVLSHKDYIFSIEFAALHFASPMKNKYVYMLEGFNEDWIETDATRRYVTYTTLKPGNYIFKVKASNNDGVWNPTPLELKITILPPFWQRWWFRGTGFFLFVGLMVAGYQLRTARIRTRNRELELRVKERTAQLEATNKELEAFSYSVSHDLRAPLRAMDGFSLALLEDYHEKLDEEGKDFLQRIRAGSQHMGRLIDDLLNLSRLTRSQMHFQKVDLSGLVEALSEELRQQDSDRKAEFFIEKNLSVMGDPSLLKVMMWNLMDNAWKFTSRKPEAKIEFGSFEEKRGRIYYIRDNGIGFDMNYSGHLFEAFHRQHNDFEGTGIGLTTVQRIIHRHGGCIWAEGKMNEGAIFYFTLGMIE